MESANDVSVYDENFDGSFYVWERWLRPGGAGKLLIGRSIFAIAGQNGNKNQQAANYDINSYLYAFDLNINEELCFN